MNFFKRRCFYKAVHKWRIKVRLERELYKTIQRITADIMKIKKVGSFDVTFLEIMVPEYRQINDELSKERIKRICKRLLIKNGGPFEG